jgi:UDP-3-O-[3-hydroxymyristoyl] glucosamine N-acyltransferase
VNQPTQQTRRTATAARAGAEHTAGTLAQRLDATLIGPTDLPIDGLETIERAGPRHLTFIRTTEFANLWAASGAGAALVSRGIEVAGHDPTVRALLIVPDADLALIKALEVFAPERYSALPGIHPTAIIDPTARIGPDVSVGAYCTIGPESEVGQGSTILAGVRIARAARIGARCTLHANVVILDRCSIGDDCTLHPGVIIGADGFGFRASPDGRGLIKIPHIGTVEIGDHVEIGANSCIDRGKFGATTVGSGTKIDNLVQIAHNCRIGRSCIICGLCGLAGSVTLGDGVQLGGQVGIADNSTIGAGARLGAMSGLKGVIPPGETWVGAPARPATEQKRNWAVGWRLAEHVRTLRRLEAIVERELGEKKSQP